MRKFLGILIIAGAVYSGWKIYLYWQGFDQSDTGSRSGGGTASGPLGEVGGVLDMQSEVGGGGGGGGGSRPAPRVNPDQLTGLPPKLEPSLQAAQKQGARGLRTWLNNYRSYVQDPRLAWIELDYVVLVARGDPAEAKRVFAEVKSRTASSSPVYARVKQLEPTYQ